MINDSIEATVDGKNLYFLSKTTINNNMHVYTNTFIIPAWASLFLHSSIYFCQFCCAVSRSACLDIVFWLMLYLHLSY